MSSTVFAVVVILAQSMDNSCSSEPNRVCTGCWKGHNHLLREILQPWLSSSETRFVEIHLVNMTYSGLFNVFERSSETNNKVYTAVLIVRCIMSESCPFFSQAV